MTAQAMAPLDLICLGYNPWSRMWKRNQQIVWGLSQEGWIGKVLFLNPEVWAARLRQGVVNRRISEPFILLVNRPADPDDPIVADLWRRAALRVFDWSDDF